MVKASHIGLSGNALKIIAMVSMLIDHIGYYLFPRLMVLRTLGRLAFPIFAFMIAEGCTYTRNRARYFAMIAGLGIVCQAAVTVASHSLYMNILLTFSLAIAAIYAIDTLCQQPKARQYALAILTLAAVAFVTFVLPRILRGFILDYDEFGVLLPIFIYYAKGKWRKILAAALLLAVFCLFSPPKQLFCLIALPLLALYNGKRGKANIKYLFYVFYPAHQAILWLIAEFFM